MKKSKAGENGACRRALPLLLALLVLMAGFVLLASAFAQPNYSLSNLSKKKSANISLEIADTDFARLRGLMFRERIIPMLFVFDSQGKFPIHSNFVIAEFDAVYVSEGGRVNEMFRKIPPGTKLVSPKKDSLYLLELPPELTDRLQIGEGDTLSWKELNKKT